jgi:hypothetical protein
MNIALYIIALMEVEMISWKIYIIMEFCFDIVRFKSTNIWIRFRSHHIE